MRMNVFGMKAFCASALNQAFYSLFEFPTLQLYVTIDNESGDVQKRNGETNVRNFASARYWFDGFAPDEGGVLPMEDILDFLHLDLAVIRRRVEFILTRREGLLSLMHDEARHCINSDRFYRNDMRSQKDSWTKIYPLPCDSRGMSKRLMAMYQEEVPESCLVWRDLESYLKITASREGNA